MLVSVQAPHPALRATLSQAEREKSGKPEFPSPLGRRCTEGEDEGPERLRMLLLIIIGNGFQRHNAAGSLNPDSPDGTFSNGEPELAQAVRALVAGGAP